MTDEMTVLAPQEQEKISTAESWATALQVVDTHSHREALEGVKGIKALKNGILAFFKPSRDAAHKAHAIIVAQEKSFTDKLERAEKAAKTAIMTYELAEEAKRRAEQAKLQAAADERCRKERERLEKEAAKLKTPELKEARLAQAEAVLAPVIQVASKIETKGSSIRRTWVGEVVDMNALITAATAPGSVAATFLEVNETAVRKFAAATKGNVSVPGVSFKEESGLSVRI